MAADGRWMALALVLGRRGMGRVWPNPAVGCVIVRDGIVVGRGHTADGGRPHAEAQALAQAGQATHGATAYVSLEPCAHSGGRGPNCTGGLIAAGVVRVVTALQDPDPRTSGKGHAALQTAGIAVETGCLAAQAAQDLAGFLRRVQGGRPWLTLKLATTIDGRIATATGQSKWITGPLARRDVHALRARHDAVMIGRGTALADDPELTARDIGITRQPVRVVVDTRLRLSPDSRLGRSARQVPVWLIHGPDAAKEARVAWENAGAQLIGADKDAEGHVAADDIMQALSKAGLTRVLCEGGGGLAASLLAANVVDEIITYQAGHVFGGDGLAAVQPYGVTALGGAPFTLAEVRQIGPDQRTRWMRQTQTVPPH